MMIEILRTQKLAWYQDNKDAVNEKRRKGRPEVQPVAVPISWNPRISEHDDRYDRPLAVCYD
jgi:hypothetical protein